ncbi:MAG: transcription elongation factor GreA [Candidatus Blackburnbacteria bacterium RIFCSPHIGHO2_02_FULL_39_13]|uniref:Transcription elongation factor GreA n=1 Tax=Candidatus Blackburnbacteria bacterium RIFCSPLOWO2_01_FULL_40_20 TaxID=1797519 RepID=A0A1G1VFG1_9BACT|nr:MAG: Transcription elongation factor GreA [Microgenomates group bacterium GW2011_GWA2_39_19]OGY06762.1 MAG: transcription elongation factor GreA [Candidatus Blackburnbacteria bacterium RIFCSPHIGHO2_01_FULL_40_17]OGY09777.1 MAG: transcription elongation factor GreA [Candidatus Blackburnbacteria bacterium RIFCSPHIGHO2_02_FULL_39_13]OGY14057.1 MAG: transcription elongation factor GreA [Candidatus Blackburnbacteria bacterium RIFCSPLOWO2_01_FULL_40_20]HBL52260.1 transcription elongation factor Gr
MLKINYNQRKRLTLEGFEQLKKELEELKNKRPGIVDRLANARSMGDLSENNDYHNALEALEFLDNRISELEEVIKTAEVVKQSSSNSSEVSLGSKVKVGINGRQHVFHIVGEWEADPQEKKISHESPLGRALVGRKVGQEVEVEAPAGKVVYKIISIE